MGFLAVIIMSEALFICLVGAILIIVDMVQVSIDKKAEEKEISDFYATNLPKVQRVVDVIRSCKTEDQLYAAWRWGWGVITRFKHGIGYSTHKSVFQSMLDTAFNKKEMELTKKRYNGKTNTEENN